jgi:hypothetical protein
MKSEMTVAGRPEFVAEKPPGTGIAGKIRLRAG